jgi:hypothetical protein
MTPEAPPHPRATFALGVTGHRLANPALAASLAETSAVLAAVFARIGDLAESSGGADLRLHSLLNDGTDQLAAELALAQGWELVAPLPFGQDLDCAINATPPTAEDAEALLAGRDPVDPACAQRATALRAIGAKARRFELAERDAEIAALYLARLRDMADPAKFQAASFTMSERVALAGRVMIEQSDLIVAVWDGASTKLIGGTGATIAHALELGTPVLWIDPAVPADWRLLFLPEELAAATTGRRNRDAALANLVTDTIGAAEMALREGRVAGPDALLAEHWRPKSPRFWHAYRRIEALFGEKGLSKRFRSLRQTYALPATAAAVSDGSQLADIAGLAGQEPGFAAKIGQAVLARFTWADAISARMSDIYRSGMILNFVFSAFAIVGGIAYLPLASAKQKWIFSSFELTLLLAILLITLIGQKFRWHSRWFETRRVAEYLRHAPLLLAAGVSRPTGRWPKGTKTAWPELYARHAIRSVGLPALKLTPHYLHGAIRGLLLPYATSQRDYHEAKAKRLSATQHNLDKLSEVLFLFAVVTVSSYLTLKLGGTVFEWSHRLSEAWSPQLTFLGVMLPTFGAAIAGIRYFGDFERFAAISEVTAERLDGVIARLTLLSEGAAEAVDYGRVSDLTHAIDEIVVDEIESWQSVFAGKHVTVPV